MVPASETRIVVAADPLFRLPERSTSFAVIVSVLLLVVRVRAAMIVKSPAPLSSVSESMFAAPLVARLSFRVTPFCAFRVSAPLAEIPLFVASSVIDSTDVRVTPAAIWMLSLVSAALSASPSSCRCPVSVVTFTLTEIPSSACTVTALKVDAVVEKATDELSLVALSVTMPVMLLLLAAVMPSTVMSPFVASPMVRPVAVMF